MPARGGDRRAKSIAPEEAAGLVRSGMWLDYGATLCQPDVFDAALARRIGAVTNLGIRSAISLKPRAVLEADRRAATSTGVSQHFSGTTDASTTPRQCAYMPVNLGEIPDYYRRFIDPVDIVVLKTRPMDEHGWFNFGLTSVWHRAIVERARTVIVETHTGLPHVHGESNGVHVSEGRLHHRRRRHTGPRPAQSAAGPVERAVGRLIAGEIEDGRLPADRQSRHAERRLHRTAGERMSVILVFHSRC